MSVASIISYGLTQEHCPSGQSLSCCNYNIYSKVLNFRSFQFTADTLRLSFSLIFNVVCKSTRSAPYQKNRKHDRFKVYRNYALTNY